MEISIRIPVNCVFPAIKRKKKSTILASRELATIPAALHVTYILICDYTLPCVKSKTFSVCSFELYHVMFDLEVEPGPTSLALSAFSRNC